MYTQMPNEILKSCLFLQMCSRANVQYKQFTAYRSIPVAMAVAVAVAAVAGGQVIKQNSRTYNNHHKENDNHLN